MKKEIDKLDATPSKRLFLSIIADYDLNKGICELIDNGIDVWIRNGKLGKIEINIKLEKDQQKIIIEDNAGGLAKHELSFIIGPGQTGTNPTQETIGIFGVGTKRAVVALAEDIRIKTRYRKEKTYEIDFDDTWINEEDWELPVYEITNISEGTTIIELQSLRLGVTDNAISQLKEHLKATYAKFLKTRKIILTVNGEKISPLFFENWAYPPNYEPQKYTGVLNTEDGYKVNVEVIAGLSKESSPATGEYGVYFYCNDRLISRALKTFEVGFTKGLAGIPHPKISLTRVIVSLNGDARCMPWNSSKSEINTKHQIFTALHNWLVQVVKDYASLSRVWMGDWPEKVFQYDEGVVKEIAIPNFPEAKKSFLPPLPQSRPRFGDRIIISNKRVAKQKPWTKGLYEGIIATHVITSQKLEQKNRIALIVLDSTLEIAFKEYLVNESGSVYNDARLLQIFSKRNLVHDEIKKYIVFSRDTWKKIEYYYRLRCKLVHERVTVGISPDQINDFIEIVEEVLKKLYKLKFKI